MADSIALPAKAKPRGKPFQKGQSGNPGGKPKGVAEVTVLARSYSAEAIQGLREIAANKKSPAQARVAAWNSLLDRGFGKPAQSVSIGPKTDAMEDLSDSELAAIAKGEA